MNELEEKRFSEAETAKVLGVSAMTVRRHRESGSLAYYQLGKRIFISESQILDFLQKHEKKAVSKSEN